MPFRCFIIGQTSLAVRCGMHLLDQGHEIAGLITADAEVKQWAESRGVAHHAWGSEARAALARQPFDVLFSIVNPHILPPDLLALPRHLAVNYHDGPLPRYAGVHATAWALHNQETTHGITWHVMVPAVDAGDVLVQRSVPITATDITFTLNAKCYAAGYAAFEELVGHLEAGTLNRRPQPTEGRTQFGLHQRPPAASLLRWDQPAAALDALVRALNFGPYPNTLGLPKLWLDGTWYTVRHLAPQPGPPKLPGTLTRLTPEALQVATATQPVRIEQVFTLEGEPVPLPTLIARHALRVGTVLTWPAPDALARLDAHLNRLAPHEGFWLREGTAFRPTRPPYAAPQPASHTPTPHRLTLTWPPTQETAHTPETRWLTLLALYTARLADTEAVGFGLQVDAAEGAGLLAEVVPLTLRLDLEADLPTNLDRVAQHLQHVRTAETYLRDLPARHPGLQPPTPAVLIHPPDAAPAEAAWAFSFQQETCTLLLDAAEYDAATAERIGGQLRTLMASIAAAPAHPVAHLNLLPEAERKAVLTDFNQTDTPYPVDRCVHDLVAHQATTRPTHPAVADLTYAELDAQANRLGRYLSAQGIGPGTRVALYLDRSAHLAVAALAVLKTGAAYLPIDPAYPAARVQFMVDDAEVRACLTCTALQAALPALACPVLRLDADDFSTAAGALPAQRDVEAPAYVIYTSGSTGRPKGVVVAHRALLNLVYWHQAAYAVTPEDRATLIAGVGFDASVWELWPYLTCGASLHIPAPETRMDPPQLRDWLIDQQISITFIPTPLAERLLALPWPRTVPLRQLLTGGGRLHPYAPPDLPFALFNNYGPTEHTVVATAGPVPPAPEAPAPLPDIGRPIHNTRAYVLDRWMQPVPIGAPGTLYLGGASLAEGYLHRPELTAERFIPNPFGTGKLYDTGDLVRWRPEGTLDFIGRIDTQVKVRGFRVELGEIEQVLAAHEAVAEAAVVDWTNPAGHMALVGYVVPAHPAAGAYALELTLREYLADQVPAYMIPSVFMMLRTLPLNANGKIDRSALPEPMVRRAASKAYTPPRNDQNYEHALCTLWSQLLDVYPIGIDDDFFDLGGTSMLAVELMAEIEQGYGRNVPLAALFEAPTVRALAARLRAQPPTGAWHPIVPMRTEGTRPPLFLTHGRGNAVFEYVSLVRRLGNDQPVYGLQGQGADGGRIRFRSIEEIAEAYVAAVCAVQPEGPYYLAGFCESSLLALEMAQRLTAEGREVALLCFFDLPSPEHWHPEAEAEAQRDYCALPLPPTLDEQAALPKRKADPLWIRLPRALGAKVRRLYYRAYTRLQLARGRPVPQRMRYLMIQDTYRRFFESYVPKPYPGRIAVVRSTKYAHVPPDLGWAAYAGAGIDPYYIAGGHTDMLFEPYVAEVAHFIRAQMDQHAAPAAAASEQSPSSVATATG